MKMKLPRPQTFFIALILLAISTHASFADSGTTEASSLGDVICNAFVNVRPIGRILELLSWAFGVLCAAGGIHHFRLHSENPGQNNLMKPLGLWFAAMCLFSLPSVIATIIVSLYGSPASGGALACSGGSTPSSGTTIDTMLTGFVGNIKGPLFSLTSLVAITAGFLMIVHGLMKASKYGFDARTHSVHSILTNILFGALLMTIGDNMNMMLDSVFGGGLQSSATAISASSVLSWKFVSTLGGGSQQFANAIAAALDFIRVIGAIAFVRGWMILKKVVEGGGNASLAQGITHVVGGVCAFNIGNFIQILDSTLGTGLFS